MEPAGVGTTAGKAGPQSGGAEVLGRAIWYSSPALQPLINVLRFQSNWHLPSPDWSCISAPVESKRPHIGEREGKKIKTVPILGLWGKSEMDADLENGILWILPKKLCFSIGMHCVLNGNSRQKGKSLLFQPGHSWNLIYSWWWKPCPRFLQVLGNLLVKCYILDIDQGVNTNF